MFDHGVSPDLRYCDHPAVRVPPEPERVLVDLRYLNKDRRGVGPKRSGLPVGLVVEGLLLSRVMTDWGHWLGDCVVELVEGGQVVATTRLLAPQWAITEASLRNRRALLGKTSNRPVMGGRPDVAAPERHSGVE